jgi:hypothetical protein
MIKRFNDRSPSWESLVNKINVIIDYLNEDDKNKDDKDSLYEKDGVLYYGNSPLYSHDYRTVHDLCVLLYHDLKGRR